MTALESNSSLPISVDLPSSTEPAVAMRSNVAMSEFPSRSTHVRIPLAALDPCQKYPSRLRSSMPASEIRSSARVAPRSVSRDTAVSAITSDTVPASDSTHPVHVTSPTVRNRTVFSSTGSSLRGCRCWCTARNMPSRRNTWRWCA